MLIPSERVFREMYCDPAGIWYVPMKDAGVGLLLKAPTPTLKAVIFGCPIDLLFGQCSSGSNSYLCTGARFHDTSDKPLIVVGLQRHADDHSALTDMLVGAGSPVSVFNELDMCVASARGLIDRQDADRSLKLLDDAGQLFCDEFTQEARSCLDRFEVAVDRLCEGHADEDFKIVSVPISFSDWEPTTNHFIGYLDNVKYEIHAPNEGAGLETAIWYSLDSVFPGTLHKNPMVKRGNAWRELIDVLSFYSLGVLLIESKALTELGAGPRRSLERKMRSLKQHIHKAIRQLVGATKAIRSDAAIRSMSGEEITFNRDLVPHCIILAAELPHTDGWFDVVEAMMLAARETGAFFHLLDLRELLFLLKATKGQRELIDYNLMQRFARFIETRSVHIRSALPLSHTSD